MSKEEIIKNISEGILELLNNGSKSNDLVIYINPKDLKKLIPKGYESMTIKDVPLVAKLEVPTGNYWIL